MKEADIRHIHTLLCCRDEATRLLEKIEIGRDLIIQQDRNPLSPSLIGITSDTFRDFLRWQADTMQAKLNLLGIR